MKLYKTTIVIWSPYDAREVKLINLARDATSGESYCAKMKVVEVDNPTKDPDWDGTEFFNLGED